ncbi:TPA: hypothetical protein ACKQBZ_000595 [Stenotrophomonas maltophilia]
MDAIEKRVRELLASCLDEWGYPCEAENVREGDDLESYELELRLLSQLLRFGMDTADGHGRTALTPPAEPDQALLVSMAVCLDHGFGMATLEQQESRLRDMRKLWDEVMGRGYYSPENRERYIAMLAASPKVS